MQCESPYLVDNPKFRDTPDYKQPQKLPVRCGKCPACQDYRVSTWAFRLQKQSETAINSYFVTLTYDTRKVPITKNGFMSLRKKDLQDFFKRLRKAIGKVEHKLKYYACGEYGSKTWRPHYHVIMFNVDKDKILGNWQQGDIHIGNVSGASIAYTLKYINKPRKIPMHSRDDRQKEFSLMSKGLGKNYLTPAIIRHHKKTLDRPFIITADGFKIAMPRYYRDKILTDEEKEKQAKILEKILPRLNEKQRTDYYRHNGTFEGFEKLMDNIRQSRYEKRQRSTKNRDKI